jgi:glycerol-3-phosphate dehydrogenase
VSDAGGPFDVAVVGAGVVGTAVARLLSHHRLRVALVEAGGDVGAGTSKANTAILHTGFDAKPGSTEALLVARGSALLRAYAARAGIALERTGALLVAWDDEQLARLPSIADTARANGGGAATRALDAAELYRLEPHLGPGALGALAVEGEDVIDPWSVPLAFATEAVANGVALWREAPVTAVRAEGDGHALMTPRGPVRARFVVNAAGLQGDVVHQMFGHASFTIRPRRGELLVFDELARPLVRHVLLPVPSATTKGVLVAPTVFGKVLLGPTADDVDDRTATASTAEGVRRLLEHGRRILPALVREEVTAVYAGLRPATEQPDYRIELHAAQRYVCLGGIRSTGLTASMAIAQEALALLRAAGLDAAERDPGELAAVTVPDLGERGDRPWRRGGRIVCHCERVTAAEIDAACTSLVPPADLDGVRRRTRAMLGRCQGFVCTADVVTCTATALGRDPAALLGGRP